MSAAIRRAIAAGSLVVLLARPAMAFIPIPDPIEDGLRPSSLHVRDGLVGRGTRNPGPPDASAVPVGTGGMVDERKA